MSDIGKCRDAASSRAYFDGIGADWDRMRQGFFPDHVRERALEVAAVEAGRLAVDLGAGTGFLTEALLARGAGVIAVDQSPVMLDALRSRFAPSAGDPVPAAADRPGSPPEGAPIAGAGATPRSPVLDCRVGEAERLPIDDASVDYCLANMYLHHVERPAVAIGEMFRILKPGGTAVITDLDEHTQTWLRDEHKDRWLGFRRDDLRDWFRAAGFTAVQVDDVGDSCRATSTAGVDAAISIFVASGRRG